MKAFGQHLCDYRQLALVFLPDRQHIELHRLQNIIITATVTAFLLAANAFFVATEFALVKARGFSIQSLADQGSTSARLTAQIQQNLEAYLATCQLGITIATLGLGWVGKSAVSGLFEYMSPAIDIRDEFFYIISFVETTNLHKPLFFTFISSTS